MSFLKLGAIAVTVKAVIMATAVSLADIAFWKSLVLVFVSAFITGAFALVAAWMTVRHTSRTLQRPMTDIQQKVGADKRATDPHDLPPTNGPR